MTTRPIPSLQITLPIPDDLLVLGLPLRREGEPISDLILRLAKQGALSLNTAPNEVKRTGIQTRYFFFPEGFEIFRTINGKKYSAKVLNGKWATPNGKQYVSLNDLSRSVTSTPENAWLNWNYINSSGAIRCITELRDQDKIVQRRQHTWRDDIVAALQSIGGSGTLHEIYVETTRIRKKRGVSLPPNANAIIRRELENNSSDSESFTGRFDLFKSVKGIGSGTWALR